jgi:hypothetical protein
MVKRYVKGFVMAILFLIFYFVIFVNFAPQILSFINSFVDANSDMFKIRFKTQEFVYNATSNKTDILDKYITIDFTIFMKFLAGFVLYVIIPFGVIFILFKR